MSEPLDYLTLHTLLRERSVTRAAAALGITQSSMSHRLARLRAVLQDPLLVRSGRAVSLTARAEAMRGPVEAALTALDAAVRARPFDPGTSRLDVTVVMPDLVAPLVPALVTAFQREAPGLQLRVRPPSPTLAADLETGDVWLGLVALHDAAAHLRRVRLGTVRFGVAMRAGHPLARGPLSVKRWLAFPQVVVRTGTPGPNTVARGLADARLARTVGLEVPSFLSALIAVASSDLVLNAPLLFLDELAPRLGVVLREAPVALPTVAAALVWHERAQLDPAHRWVRERVQRTVQAQLAQRSS